MSKRSERMYGNSPTMKRDEDTGEMGVHKKEAKEPEKGTLGEVTEGGKPAERHAHERIALHHKHVKEHLELHHKHEVEHAHHKGEKKALHERHEKEYGEMHKNHEGELKKLHAKHQVEGEELEVDGPHEHEEKVDQKKKDGLLGEAKKTEKE